MAIIQFIGGSKTVTGSKTLITEGKDQYLVDCGMFQGLKELRLLNREKLPFDAKNLKAVFLTHAHLDHSGFLPLLVKQGFRGPIYCSLPTIELAKLILLDSAHVQEEDAAMANRLKSSRHDPALPLYTTLEAKKVFPLFRQIAVNQKISIAKDCTIKLIPNGHILGSTSIWLQIKNISYFFSGDVGRSNPLLLHEPGNPENADVFVTESTYGDRSHPKLKVDIEILKNAIERTYETKGSLLIPSFSVGRAQEILYLISKLTHSRKVPKLPIYLDSPMAIEATEIFLENPEWHTLTKDEVLDFHEGLIRVNNQTQSLELSRSRKPSIIVAGSGMITGGRILNHLMTRLSKKNTTVLLVGYMAPGTRGRLLKDGAKDIKIYGTYVPVKAKIECLESMSAHADQSELVHWFQTIKKPKYSFINHGELQASEALLIRLRDECGWKPVVTSPDQTYTVNP